jgi:hypothetical protein
MLLETETALSAVKFKKDFENNLKRTSLEYAKMIHDKAIKYQSYAKCDEIIMDWIFCSMESAIETLCTQHGISSTVYLSYAIDGTGAADINQRHVYIQKKTIDSYVKNIFDDLTTFVYGPNNKNYDESNFTPDAIAEGMMDGYLYSITSTKSDLIATVIHEVSHLIQTKKESSREPNNDDVHKLNQIQDKKSKHEYYLNRPMEIDAFANGEVAKYILDNPDFTLADIQKETVYLTNQYRQHGNVLLTKETTKKFASKIFKLLYNEYKSRK